MSPLPLRWTKNGACLVWDGVAITLESPTTTLSVQSEASREDRFEAAAARAVGVELVAEV